MRKVGIVVALLSVFFFTNIYLSYSQEGHVSKDVETKTCDVNNDGKADVTYYSDGQYAQKIEADTNYDGEPDVVVHTKDGKFESAEVDTDYDGKADKKFTDVDEFNKWLNQDKPDFNDKLNKTDWRFNMLEF